MKKLNTRKILLRFCLITMVTVATVKYGSAQMNVINVQDSIAADTHWTCDNQYLLHGYVYVTNGHTLTIDAGTIIKGDKDSKGALIVERGAKIYAVGTVDHPIIFTSNQPAGQRTYGDWGGVILCGYAPCNWVSGVGQVEGGPRSLYGGTDPHDNSGQMSYCRVEFGGIAFSPNNEINGLTFCSVGDATVIDHIQVSYSGDDSYEFFGGTVNTKYMVAYRTWDDDFDTDNGYAGYNQYGVCLRDPYAADQSGSKGFESDSYQSGTVSGLTDTTELTKPVFTNYTLVGPLVSPTSTSYDPQFVAGAHIRRGSSISILNSLIIGWPCGILIDESSASFGSTVANIQDNHCAVRNDVVCGIPTTNAPGRKEVFYVIDGARSLTSTTVWGDTTTGMPFNPFAGPFDWYKNPPYHNTIYATEQSGLKLQAPFTLDNPNFIPTSTSPICYNSKALPSYVTAYYGSSDPFGNGGKYPYNGTLPINTDTSNFFANYNAPDLVPDFSIWKLQNSFFTVENHIGAFNYTASTTDNWTAGWCNWDPVNTDYTTSNCNVGINTPVKGSFGAAFYPNPSDGNTELELDLANAAIVNISIYDLSGKMVWNENALHFNAGIHDISVNVNLASGVYMAKIATQDLAKSIKMVVSK